ncbi:MAG: NAD(P)H-dependent glycerol-3-phosphate dehydrogenase [Bacillota bacterium]
MSRRVAVVGAGAWGTALTIPLVASQSSVALWCRRPELAEEINATGCNHAYLPGVPLGPVWATGDLQAAVAGAGIVILGLPSAVMRPVCRALRPYLPEGAAVVSTAKALDFHTLERMSEVISAELGIDSRRVLALSGPNFAVEVVQGLPTATVVGGEPKAARLVQEAIMTDRLRVYTNPDICGVELGGALKNVIAIAVGIADGMGLGLNARAALITRGLAEMTRLGRAMGARPSTFSGLSGMGDLVLTCTGEYSRNRQAGIALGQGSTMKEFLSSTGLVVEGANTARAAWQLALRYQVDMPITEEVHHILFGGRSPQEGLARVMSRSPKEESEEVAANGGLMSSA